MDIRDSQRIKEIRDNTKAVAEAFSSIANTLADALELFISTRTETQTETQNSNLTFEKDECAKEYEELGLKELKELIEADRKTENSSEKPNNCADCECTDDCTECREAEHGCKDEPTISKMEQVEETQTEEYEWCTDCKEYDQERHCCPRWNKVIRQTIADLKDMTTEEWLAWKNETQTEWDARNCMSCKYNAWVSKECNGCNGKHYEPKDETRLTAKCLNCANGSSYKCSKCDGEMYYKYDKDEPTWEQVKEYCNKRCLDIVDSALRKKWYKDEPHTERSE